MMRVVKIIAVLMLISMLEQIPLEFFYGAQPASLIAIERSLESVGFSESEIDRVISERMKAMRS